MFSTYQTAEGGGGGGGHYLSLLRSHFLCFCDFFMFLMYFSV